MENRISSYCPVCGHNETNVSEHMSSHSKEEIIQAILNPRSQNLDATRDQCSTSFNYSTPTSSSVPNVQPPVVTVLHQPMFRNAVVRFGSGRPPAGSVSVVSSASFDGQRGMYVLGSGNIQQTNGASNVLRYLMPQSGSNVVLTSAAPVLQPIYLPTLPLSQVPLSHPQLNLPFASTLPRPALSSQNWNLRTPTGPIVIRTSPQKPKLNNEAFQPHHPPGNVTLTTPILNSVRPTRNFVGVTSQVAMHDSVPGPSSMSTELKMENVSSKQSCDTIIKVGQHISISLPKDLVHKQKRLQDIINEELVRALLINDDRSFENDDVLVESGLNQTVEEMYPVSTSSISAIQQPLYSSHCSSLLGPEFKSEITTPFQLSLPHIRPTAVVRVTTGRMGQSGMMEAVGQRLVDNYSNFIPTVNEEISNDIIGPHLLQDLHQLEGPSLEYDASKGSDSHNSEMDDLSSDGNIGSDRDDFLKDESGSADEHELEPVLTESQPNIISHLTHNFHHMNSDDDTASFAPIEAALLTASEEAYNALREASGTSSPGCSRFHVRPLSPPGLENQITESYSPKYTYLKPATATGLEHEEPYDVGPLSPLMDELSVHHPEEVMSLKATETLSDSDSERASPLDEMHDLMFYERSCMFAGEPGPAALSPPPGYSVYESSYESMDLIGHFDDTANSMESHSGPDMLPVTSDLSPPVEEVTSGSFSNHLEEEFILPPYCALSEVRIKTDISAASHVTSWKCTSPIPSTSSGLHLSSIEDVDYGFDYESDWFGDSDSDSFVRGLDGERWQCSTCHTSFKSLKEKLLHSGQHYLCRRNRRARQGMGYSRENLRKSKRLVKLDPSEEEMPQENEKDFAESKHDPVIKVLTVEELDAQFSNNGNYRCPECNLEKASFQELHDHRISALKSRFMCAICHQEFETTKMQERHMKTHEMNEFMCKICNRLLLGRWLWADHQLFHLGDVKFECGVCGIRLKTRLRLEEHERAHTKDKPFSCTNCSFSFRSKQGLRRHRLKHIDSQEMKCSTCDKVFKNSFLLHSHRLSQHQQQRGKKFVRVLEDFLCDTCGEAFRSPKRLAWHKEIHERWPKKCHVCGERYVHRASLVKHIRRVHNPEHRELDDHEQSASCPVCRRVCNRYSLTLHMRTHTGERPFKCTVCAREFSFKCNLEAHRWVHMSNRDRPFKCKLCERNFHRKREMELHMRTHTGERPYTCNDCGKTFARRNVFKEHMRLHTGSKDHKCDVCGKAFARKYNLDNHIRIHTGEMPFECTICRKDFTQKSNYNNHMKAFHTERHTVHEEA